MKISQFISLTIIILAIFFTFKNSCGLGKILEPMRGLLESSKEKVDYVIFELYNEECKEGEERETGGCKPCSVGTFNNILDGSCVECPSGTYQDSTGQTSCIKCPSGRYQHSTGKTSCIEEFSGRNCNEPRLYARKKPGEDTYTPIAWDSGLCMSTAYDSSSGEIISKLCRGKNRNRRGYDSSCPKKYIITNNNTDTADRTLHPAYDNVNCEIDDCFICGKYALQKIKQKKNIRQRMQLNKFDIEQIGKQILACYNAIKNHDIKKGERDSMNNANSEKDNFDFGGYEEVFVRQIKEDTKNIIDNLFNLELSRDRSYSPRREFNPYRSIRRAFNQMSSGGDFYGSNNDFRNYIAKKRRNKDICNFMRSTTNVNTNDPHLFTPNRTTNQFGEMCIKSGYYGLPQYTGFNDEQSYPNANEIDENLNERDLDKDVNGKYPKVSKTDPKPYNGIWNLF